MNECDEDIRITFGIIVLNGEPFIKYNLRSLYPFAYQIVLVEGANKNSAHCATPDGHSIDGTINSIREFKELEDPENKVVFVTAEDEGHPNGFWPGEKDEQSQAFSKRATGNWLWQIDVDEFYLESDMRNIITMLKEDPSICTVSFPELPFWGSFDYRVDGILLRIGYSEVHRLFKWRPGYRYLTHRPVTVVDEQGIDLRKINWVRSNSLRSRGIYMYHYYKLFLGQVAAKMIYYANRVADQAKPCVINGEKYFDKTFLKLENPYRVHMFNRWPSWLVKFEGVHPRQIQELRNDLVTGKVIASTRNMDDVDALVGSTRYRIGIELWKIWGNYVSQINWELRLFLQRRSEPTTFLANTLSILVGKRRLF